MDAQGPPANTVSGFARFFRAYIGLASVVTGAIPIPLTSWGVIPTYQQQTNTLAALSSLFCFILFGFVFYSRHSLSKLLFERPKRQESRMQVFLRQLPLLLALLSLGMGLGYWGSLQISLQHSLALWRDRAGLELSTADLLKSTEYADISYAMPLAFLYIGTFVTAEGALLIMALAEYLRELAHKE